MTSHSDAVATDNTRAAVAGTVATVGGSVSDGATAGDGKVPPTADMFALDSRVRGNDGAVVVGGGDGVGDRAVVVGTVGTVTPTV